MRHSLTLCILCLLLVGNVAKAQNRDINRIVPNKDYIGLYFEDDFFYNNNFDEQYSGGIELEWVHSIKAPKSKLLNPLQTSNYAVIASYGFTVFTPDSIAATQIVRSDRPYASYQFGSIGFVSIDSITKRKVRAQLYLGWFGTEFPNRVQNWSHTALTPDTDSALGWNNQIGNGGTFAPNLEIQFDKQFFALPSCTYPNIDYMQLGFSADINIGGYLNSGSLGIRMTPISVNSYLSTFITPSIPEGFIVEKDTSSNGIVTADTLNYSKLLSRNFVNTFRKDDKDKPTINRGRNWAFNIYAFPQLRFIGHSSSLQGLLFNDQSVYTLNSSEVNRFLWNWEFGSNVVIARHLHIGASVQIRKAEHTKFNKNTHSFGAVSLGYTW